MMEKRILEVKHTKNISYLEATKFIENSLAITIYANIVKPTNNSTQNQRMMTPFDMINLIKELKTLLELLRESLTNLTTKPHAELDPKKNFHPHKNQNKPNKNSTQSTTNSRHPSHHYKTQQSPTKKIGWYWKLTGNPQKEISLEEGIYQT